MLDATALARLRPTLAPRRESGPIFVLAAAFSLTHINPDYYARARRAFDDLGSTEAGDDAQLLIVLRQAPELLPVTDALLARLARAGATTSELCAIIDKTRQD